MCDAAKGEPIARAGAVRMFGLCRCENPIRAVPPGACSLLLGAGWCEAQADRYSEARVTIAARRRAKRARGGSGVSPGPGLCRMP
jgi:hypothetical protein